MPIKNAAKKALRQSFRRQRINDHYERKIKSLIKEARILVAQKKAKEAKDLLPDIYQILDKAAKVGTIKKITLPEENRELLSSSAKHCNYNSAIKRSSAACGSSFPVLIL